MRNTRTIYSSTERTPTVLPEMAELLPPLTGEQLAALEADILKNGCYSPVIVNEDMVVIDGHNRQRLCEQHGHLVGQAVLFAQSLAVVAVNDHHVLVDDHRGVTAVFQDVRFQGGKLLPRQRGEQFSHLRQDGGAALRTAVYGSSVAHQAASPAQPSSLAAAAASSTLRGDRNSTSLALIDRRAHV